MQQHRVEMSNEQLQYAIDGVRENWALMYKFGEDPLMFFDWLGAVQKITETFLKKNSDYGSKNIGAGGVQGIVVRLGDKISRVWNLVLNKHENVIDESVADTFLDIAAYGIMGYMLVSGLWEVDDISESVGLPALIDYWMANNTISNEDINKITVALIMQGMVTEGFPGEVVAEE